MEEVTQACVAGPRCAWKLALLEKPTARLGTEDAVAGSRAQRHTLGVGIAILH